MKRWSVLLVFALVLQLALAVNSSAHTRLGSSDPPNGAELAESPSELRLSFTGGFDVQLSGIELIDASGQLIAGELRVEERTMIYMVPELAPGAYEVKWRLLSADTHVTDGSFRFIVLAPIEPPPGGDSGDGAGQEESTADDSFVENGEQEGQPADDQAIDDDLTVDEDQAIDDDLAFDEDFGVEEDHGEHGGLDVEHTHGSEKNDWRRLLHIVLRVAELFAVTWLAGIFFFRTWIWGNDRPGAPRLFALNAERIAAAVVCLVFIATGALHVWLLADQLGGFGGQSAGGLASTIIQSTTVGQMAALRPLLALLWLVLAFAPAGSARMATAARTVLAIGFMATFPLTGHAAAGDGKTLAVLSHTVHMALAAVWVGGLVGLFAAVGRGRLDAVGPSAINAMIRKFSAIALPTLAIVAAAGAVLAVIRLEHWSQLVQSAYGRFVIVKLVLLALVVAIGYFHRRVLIPRTEAAAVEGETQLHRAHRRFALAVRGEISLAVLLLLFAGLLSSTPPPLAWSPGEPLRWHVMGEQAHMTLRMAQDSPRQQSLTLDVWLPSDDGEASSIQVRAVNETAEVNIPFEFQTGGPDPYGFVGFDKYTYSAQGEFLPEAGRWTLEVVIVDANGQRFVYEKSVLLE